MKRLYILLTVAIAFASCSETEINSTDPLRKIKTDVEFYAELGSPDTKVSFDTEYRPYWELNDKISIFSTTYNQPYKVNTVSGIRTSASFTKEGDTVSGLPLTTNYAVYPYNSENSISADGRLHLFFSPDENDYKMVAVTDGLDDRLLQFHNLCGFLVVPTYGSKAITKITLKGNNGEKISGAATVNAYYDREPAIKMEEYAGLTKWIQGMDPILVHEHYYGIAAYYDHSVVMNNIFAIPPTEFTKGFTLTIEYGDGCVEEKSTQSPLSIERNRIYRMEPVWINFFTDDEFSEAAINWCYAYYSEDPFLGREIMWEQGAANDYVWGRTKYFPGLATLNYDPDISCIGDVWNYANRVMARANWVVESLLRVQDGGVQLSAIQSRVLGEAYFMRAFCHFYLAYRHGTGDQGVPFEKYEDYDIDKRYELYDEYTRYESITQQPSVTDNYRMIVEDLDAAEALLPTYDQYSSTDFGRAHKAACEGLKAKVYAYWACWDKSKYADVITAVNKLENQYGRSISGVPFTECFSADYDHWRNTEYVVAVTSLWNDWGIGWDSYGYGIVFPGVVLDNHLYGLFNCWGQFKPSLDAYEELSKDNENLIDPEVGNIRLKNSVAEYGDKLAIWGMTDFHFYSTQDLESGFMMIKYIDPFTRGEGYYSNGTWISTVSPIETGYVAGNPNFPYGKINFPILRFADCMLLRAEANLALGDASAAAVDINAVRLRSNVKPLEGGATWTDLYHERRVELMFEHSDHLYDLKRWALSGDAEIKALAIAELESHPRVRHYTDRSNPGYSDGNNYYPNTDFTVGPYEDFQSLVPVWEDYKIAFPYPTYYLNRSNGKWKQNAGY